MKKYLLTIPLVLSLVACGGQSPEELKKLSDDDFLKTHHAITSINDRNDISNDKALILHIETNNTGKVFLFANLYKPILQDIQEIKPELLDKYNQVWLFADAELVDKFGKTSKKGIFAVAYKADDLKKVNFNNVYERALLDLVADVRIYHPEGQRIIVEYCMNDKGKTESPNFCKKAL